ncbi:hypothetical protein MYX04_14425, partial [Nitrospiraceae bacterium AH_259_D15_M11_P09]|nr:hypothetical protein [Nitrospiraceae bacterium AH_259_D15_M11_P09]
MVPAAELEAERQQRRALHVKQQHLLDELRKQSAAKGELEEQLAAEGLKRQALEQRQEQLERDLRQQSAVREALDDGVAKLHLLLEKEAHLARLTEQLEEVILKAGGMVPAAELEAERLKRQALENRQEQLERDLKQQSAVRE